MKSKKNREAKKINREGGEKEMDEREEGNCSLVTSLCKI